MPTILFVCPSCTSESEVKTSRYCGGIRPCPKCGKEAHYDKGMAPRTLLGKAVKSEVEEDKDESIITSQEEEVAESKERETRPLEFFRRK